MVNPRAGRKAALDRAEETARELGRFGWRCEIACTTAAEEATRLASEMAGAGCAVVVAAGGDGTINEVVHGLVGSGAALGVIPAGLANVWALDLGLRGASGSIPRLLRHGLVYDTDLGEINGRYFLMMAGIGFDAEIVDSVLSEDKQRWAQLAYVARAARRVAGWAKVQARISVDGCAQPPMDFFGAIITNVNKYGGVLDLAPDSKLDDGLLHALVFRDAGLARRIRSTLLADHRTRTWDSCARTFVCEELDVATDRPLLVHADAEMAGTTPCHVSVARKALPVLLPRSAEGRYLSPGRPPQALSNRSYSAPAVTELTP